MNNDRYHWAVRYPGKEGSDFAVFTWHRDANAFVTLMRLIDGRGYEIVELGDAQTD